MDVRGMSTLLNSRRREALDSQQQNGTNANATEFNQDQRFMTHQQQQQQQHESYLPFDRFSGSGGGGFSSTDFIPQSQHSTGSSALIQYDHDDDTTIIPRGGSGNHTINLNSFVGNNSLSPKQNERFSSKLDQLHDLQQQQQNLKYGQQHQQQQQNLYSITGGQAIQQNKQGQNDFSYGGSENLNSFTNREYMERVHSPDPLEHYSSGSGSGSNSALGHHDNVHLPQLSNSGRPHSALSFTNSSMSSMSSSRGGDSVLNRFSGLSEGSMSLNSRASFSQNSTSGMSSLSANELGWIKEEIERQQARDSLMQQQGGQNSNQQQNSSGSGSNSGPNSNRGSAGTTNPDALSPGLYEPNSTSLLTLAPGSTQGINLLPGGSGIMDEVKLKKYKTVMCLLYGNEVVRSNGTNARVEDVAVGDLLLGQDGAIVRVTENALGQITQRAYRVYVEGIKGSFTITSDHLLTLAHAEGSHTAEDLFELPAEELKQKWNDLKDRVRARVCELPSVSNKNTQSHVDLLRPIESIESLTPEEYTATNGFLYARLNVFAIKPTGTEADHRFLLANGVLSHNCQRMVRTGGCRYGALCDFAHDRHELRRNLDLHWYFAVKCEKRNCIDPECRYSHNDHEVMYHPRIYKSRLCSNYVKPGGCNRKMYCSFAHGKFELRLNTNTNMMMGGPNNIFGLVPPQPGVGPQAPGQGQPVSQLQQSSMPGGTTLTIQGGSQVLPRELVASLQASGISIAAPGEMSSGSSGPSASPPGYNRGSTGLIGLSGVPSSLLQGNAALNKKFQQQGVPSAYQNPYSSLSPRPSPPPVGPNDVSKDAFSLQDGIRDGASSPSHMPEMSPQYASLGLGSAAAAAAAQASAEEQADRESFRESTDHLKIRILDLVDEVAAAHYQRAMDDQAVAMANGSTFRALSNNLTQATQSLAATKVALSIYAGEEAAIASLNVNALDQLTATLQGVLAAVAAAKAKLTDDAAATATLLCRSCLTEPVNTMVWPCAHRALCASCHPDVCPTCSGPVARTMPIVQELPNIPSILAALPAFPEPKVESSRSGSAMSQSPLSSDKKGTPSPPINATPALSTPNPSNTPPQNPPQQLQQ